MSERTEEQVLQRAQRAREILTDDLFREAVSMVEQNIIAKWKSGQTPQEREEAHAKLVVLTRIVEELRVVLEQGKYVEAIAARRRR